MLADTLEINSLDDLRHFIHHTICQQNELEFAAFPLTERILVRAGVPCGIYFCLHGPRSVKFTAIWETDRNSVLFYGSTGERVWKSQLTTAPTLASLAN